MASTETSGHARKLQDDDVERLVKCRVRSEVEARKAAEATMKRAVQEARELKKELVLLRQEKQELREDARKAAMVAATTPGAVVTKEELQKKLNEEKSKCKAAVRQLESAQRECADLRAESERLAADHAREKEQNQHALDDAKEELARRQCDVEGAHAEVKKFRQAADDAKRKLQRVTKDKKDDLQRLVDENEELRKRMATLERSMEDVGKLRRQLDKTRDKQDSIANEWKAKLDQREQDFLRHEGENRRALAAKQQELDKLEDARADLEQALQEKQEEMEKLSAAHAARIQREAVRATELLATTQQMEIRLTRAQKDVVAAEQAQKHAETQEARERHLRETAEAAADAVEARADKFEQQLDAATQQLAQLERALLKKGITFDYLLKKSGAASSPSPSGPSTAGTPENQQRRHKSRALEPEDGDLADSSPVPARNPSLASTSRVGRTSAPAITSNAKEKMARRTPRGESTAGSMSMSGPAKIKKPASRIVSSRSSASINSSSSNNNNNHENADARERTPERRRK